MIRYRKPEQDDPMILQLIESQLVPLSHMTKKSWTSSARIFPLDYDAA